MTSNLSLTMLTNRYSFVNIVEDIYQRVLVDIPSNETVIFIVTCTIVHKNQSLEVSTNANLIYIFNLHVGVVEIYLQDTNVQLIKVIVIEKKALFKIAHSFTLDVSPKTNMNKKGSDDRG